MKNVIEATAALNSNNTNGENNMIAMTPEQLNAIVTNAVAAALAQQAPAQTAQQKKSMDDAIAASRSSRLTNWIGKKTMATAEWVAPKVGKIEVMAVPATQHVTGVVLTKTASWTDSLGKKLNTAGTACKDAAARNTPGVVTAETLKNKVNKFNNMTEEEKIAFIAKNIK